MIRKKWLSCKTCAQGQGKAFCYKSLRPSGITGHVIKVKAGRAEIVVAKELKTNAMRILDKNKIEYELNTYECDNFTDGKSIADMLGQDYNISFKTLVAVGKSKQYYVFVIPVVEELDLKQAAKTAGEKNIVLLHVKDINQVTGYIRGGCTPIGMKKQYPSFIHISAKDYDKIIISGGRLGTQIIINPDDLVKVTDGKYADIIIH